MSSAENIAVVIASFGDHSWYERAAGALASASRQTLEPGHVHHVHRDTLHEARNAGAEMTEAEWLIFLDADDELDVEYVESMAAFLEANDDTDWLVQPATLGVVDGVEDDEAVVIPAAANILERNWMVIGTLVRRSQFLRVGGFRDLPALEDWDLWIRCVRDGAELGVAPEAVYRVHVNAGSRNQDTAVHHRVYQDIRSRYGR